MKAWICTTLVVGALGVIPVTVDAQANDPRTTTPGTSSVNPQTGLPTTSPTRPTDPRTGLPASGPTDPRSGLPATDPRTGLPATGPIDPSTGRPATSSSGAPGATTTQPTGIPSSPSTIGPRPGVPR